jgi:NAD(P)-dependent dehydrogenase (short-subunit alcohol dehydrogenase family)
VFTSASSEGPTEKLAFALSKEHDVECALVQADLSTPSSSVHLIVEAALDVFDLPPVRKLQVDILINCAGVSSNQKLNDPDSGPIDEDEFNRVYNVNVLAPLLLTQALEPYLPYDRSGRIVNVSSVSSSIGYEGQSVYAGSKAALEAMTRTWARELAERATVNAVNPGPAWGDMYAKAGETFWKQNQKYVDAAPLSAYAGAPEEEVERVRSMCKDDKDFEHFDKLVKQSMGGMRPAFASEIAGTIDMLCSEESGWTTGSVICANGGMRMSIA